MRRLLVLLLAIASLVVVGRGQIPCDVVDTQPACDVALLPGPTRNTLELWEISGVETYPSEGQLLLTTVAVDDDLGLVEWIRESFSDETDVLDREVIYPPDETEDQVNERNAQLMVASQQEARLAGLAAAGYDLDTLVTGVQVAAIAEDPAEGAEQLEPGDQLLRVDGQAVERAAGAVDLVSSRAPGDTIVVDVLRDGEERTIEIVAGARPDDPSRALIGVVLEDQIDLPFELEVDTENIGGPSAGLMFALGIVDLLGPEDLTGGEVVAGTGTITPDGRVGAIGGIRQKLVAASSPTDDRPAASVFLVPQGNLAEARTAAVRGDILLVPVETLDDALAALQALGRGEQPADAIALGP